MWTTMDNSQQSQLVVGTAECPLNNVFLIVRQSASIKFEWSTFARLLDVPSERIKKFRQDLLLDKIPYEDLIFEVLEIWIGKNGSKATLANLLQVVEGHCGGNDVGELLRLEYKLPCKEAEDNPLFEWKDLSPAFQKQVMENFQHFSPNLKFEEVLPKLAGEALVSLMRGRKPHVLSLPEELSYYVSRTIVTRNIFSDQIFDQDSPDIFLFTGMDRYKLSRLAKDKLTGSSRQKLQCGFNMIMTKFMILDQENHFERICGKTTHPVHLLRREGDGKLRWMKSKGEMNNLREYIDQKQDELDEGQFCQMCTSKPVPVLICDTPGMGKSVLLSQIGHRLVQLHPDRTVLFIVLSEFLKLAKSIRMDDKLKVVELTLQDCVGDAFLQSKVNLAEETVSIELLLDGYDEVDSADRILALEILQIIDKYFKCIRLWITSRPHLMGELETNLNILGHSIRPFHDENQVHFLSSFWSRKIELDQERVKQFAEQCLKYLKVTMNSTDNDIAGIPLQCLLIGEVFEDDAVDYSRSDKNYEPNAAPEIEIGTIPNLYSGLVKKKIGKYKSIFGNVKWSEHDVMTIHADLSLELLFPFEHDTRKVGEIDIDEVMKAGIVTSACTGAVTFLHRTFAEYFVAWFFFDKLQQEDKWTANIFTLFLKLITGHFKFTDGQGKTEVQYDLPWEVCCYFLNSMMADLQIEMFPDNFALEFELDEWQLSLIEMTARQCLASNFVQIFKLFHDRRIFDKLSGMNFNDDFLRLSASSSVELVKSVFVLFERHHNFDWAAQKATLREAVKHGNFSIVEFLIKEKQVGSIVENFEEYNLVCDCVEGTLCCSDEIIMEKILILQMLVGIKGSLVDGLNGSSTMAPLLSKEVHVKLLIELVRLGANVLAQNIIGYTVLHLCSFYYYQRKISCQLFREDYHKLVMSIPVDKLKILVQFQTALPNRETALMSILKRFDPLPETLDIFHGVGSDFNPLSEQGDSILAVAIKNGRKAETIRKLIDLGIDVNGIDTRGNTPLHVVAQYHRSKFSMYDRYSIIKHLLEKGSNPSALNNVNETPFQALLRNKGVDFNIFRLLKSKWDERSLWSPTIATIILRCAVGVGGDDYHAFPDQDFEALAHDCEIHGGDLNWRDDQGSSLLHLAAYNGKAHAVKCLIKMGVDINSKNNQEQSPLHLSAASKEDTSLEVIKYLIENGADLLEVSNSGSNILHFAAWGRSDVLKYFLELGGLDVNGRNAYGDAPLHCSVDDRKRSAGVDCLEKCRLLIQYGADVNVISGWGKSPLETARIFQPKNEPLIKLLSLSVMNV